MKKVLIRGLSGAVIGVFIMTCISLIISAKFAKGYYNPTSIGLIRDFGSQYNAVLVQFIVSMLYGAMWSISSLVWEKEDWSVMKMTVIHLIISSTISYPVAYYMRWMDRSLSGVVSYFGVFFIIYFFIWIIGYVRIKRDIEKFNFKLRDIENK